MKIPFAAVHELAIGPTRKSRDVRFRAAFGGIAESAIHWSQERWPDKARVLKLAVDQFVAVGGGNSWRGLTRLLSLRLYW